MGRSIEVALVTHLIEVALVTHLRLFPEDTSCIVGNSSVVGS